MALEDGRYRMDMERAAAVLTGSEKIVILCSPHNPCGRVWSAEELRDVAEFCERRGLLLISDEVHHDLVFPGHTHRVLAPLVPELASRLITLVAASKTFNLAGGMTGCAIIEDAALRQRFTAARMAAASNPNRFGMLMTKAALSECADWSDAVRGYIAENFRIFAERIGALPGVTVMPMQATYLSWVDFSALGVTDAELVNRVLDAKV